MNNQKISPDGSMSATWVLREWINNPNGVYPCGIGEVETCDNSLKLRVFTMQGVPCNSNSITAEVAAPDYDTAVACMTVGSDSMWSDVIHAFDRGELYFNPEFLKTCYQSCGGYVISHR